MHKEFFLANEKATIAYGRAIGGLIGGLLKGSRVKDSIVVYLEGTLGAGKTTFCQGVLAAYNYSGQVKSPTYTLVEPYDLDGIQVYHFDLYRLGDPEELEFMGIRDYFGENTVALIEWPQKGHGYIPKADMIVSLNPMDEGRKLTITSKTERGVAVLSLLETQNL
ncbi:tRNA (adenosine(37)-N6)-threonylcarbamoyltransferase complex ATPase subunit type 1 TsaE [Agarilytica rhodophyticola]|uniref:tRNA (adenosine(37)-N6)-threonylcarbamoyltransferase complex ATPase subunit type 1 TsaE n=1 Tax=Agarilytica rhodophyticola TaxID=1737490 RepID=UPI000B34A0E4|nr:tRNA (adenosine(37)-N6)-threonylcarbamoyltransferase complex ATPase subunit type 1 TsaE [Agarilytica rhodophyticola]